MRTLGRGVLVVVVLVVGLSLVGLTEVAGALGVLGFLVTVLATTLQPLRPSRGGSGSRSARQPSFLARYRPADEAESIAGVVIAGLAAWEILESLRMTDVRALSAGLLLPVVAYVVAPNAVAALLGIAGSVAVIAGLVVDRSDCADVASPRGLAIYGAVLVTSVLVVLSVRCGWFGLRLPLSDRIGRGAWALIMFGLLDVAAFAVHPNGIEIWQGAPTWAPAALLGLVVAIAFFAGYAPSLVLGLTALGVALGQLLLGVAAADLVTGFENPCGDPAVGVAYAIAFVVLAVAGLALRPGRRS